MSATRADAPSTSWTQPPNRAEWIAAALDQQQVGEGDRAWTVHVLGFHTEGSDIWIQVASDADGTDAFVLHLSQWASVQHALAALAAARSESGTYPQVVPVMRSA